MLGATYASTHRSQLLGLCLCHTGVWHGGCEEACKRYPPLVDGSGSLDVSDSNTREKRGTLWGHGESCHSLSELAQ